MCKIGTGVTTILFFAFGFFYLDLYHLAAFVKTTVRANAMRQDRLLAFGAGGRFCRSKGKMRRATALMR